MPLPLAATWNLVADVAAWPNWAHHIRSVEMEPPGPASPVSQGRFHFRGGMRSAFRMTAFEPGERWEWVRKVATLTVRYDHRFDAVDAERTRLTWSVRAEGPGRRVLHPVARRFPRSGRPAPGEVVAGS